MVDFQYHNLNSRVLQSTVLGADGVLPANRAAGKVWNSEVWNGDMWNGEVWNGEVWNSEVWNGEVWNGEV